MWVHTPEAPDIISSWLTQIGSYKTSLRTATHDKDEEINPGREGNERPDVRSAFSEFKPFAQMLRGWMGCQKTRD